MRDARGRTPFRSLIRMPLTGIIMWCGAACLAAAATPEESQAGGAALDSQLQAVLKANGFTGHLQGSVERRLGRPINQELQNLGRQLFFDPIHGLHDDNSCAGCHDPAHGFADSQPIAIGVQNQGMIVGATRTGPRNQRRTPTIINAIFYPSMMWDGRFFAPSRDPFDNSQGFVFPPPEGNTKFPPNDPNVTFLAIAQAHMPSTELKEEAGYTGTSGELGRKWNQFDDGLGEEVPPPDGSGYRNDPIRAAVEVRVNASPAYRRRFGRLFADVAAGDPITFTMIAQALAEWEATMVRADAPIDRFARGNVDTMTDEQKHGALLFFGKANCVACHGTRAKSYQMFSDFKFHDIGVPQIAPFFGVGKSNVVYDGPGRNEDFGLEEVTHLRSDRYKFRTPPLRNLAMQPRYFHNGSFDSLARVIRHHLDVVTSALDYDPAQNGVPQDLQQNMGPIDPVLARLDPLVQDPIVLTDKEFRQLLAFVRDGLQDPKDTLADNCRRIPARLPSGMTPMQFVDCPEGLNDHGQFQAADMSAPVDAH
jgi:cytochrome c peroxidase